MTDRTVRVLLVDGRMEDSRWVQELLVELEESRYSGGWAHGLEIFSLDRLSDAITVLGDTGGSEQFDVVLLNPDLPDSMGLHSYLRLQAAAPLMPVVILAELDDPDLAISMVRAGAQDFLAKSQLDSLPLARSLRLAVERGRIVRDLKAQSGRDELTGLANRNAFDTATRHDVACACYLDVPLAVLMIELTCIDQLAKSYGREEQHLAIMEAAEIVRVCAPSGANVAKIALDRFALSMLVHQTVELSRTVMLLDRRFQRFLRNADRSQLRVRFGTAWFHPSRTTEGLREELTVGELLGCAAQSLCENKGDFKTVAMEKERYSKHPALANSTGRNI